MAKQEHYDILGLGVVAWNEWRREHPDVRPDLTGAELWHADLAGANLEDTNFEHARLTGADLEDARLSRANLRGVNLEGARVAGANLEGANLSVTDLRRADFKAANLSSANFERARLTGVNLEDANLHSANLTQAFLGDANLAGADLSEANLWQCGIDQEQLQQVKSLHGATLPDGSKYVQPSAGAEVTAITAPMLSSEERQPALPTATTWPPAGFHDPAAQHTAEANAPAVWQVGDVILEQYEVLDILGEGGMGTVYKVHHRGWNTDLAVKSPRPQIFARAGGKENFIREAQTWVNLGLHPHIVSCYYVRTLGGIPRIFAEYVEGGSLADWIRTRKLYEGSHEQALERMLDVAIQFAWGLHSAHEQGLVHQDVKPDNVMLTADGTTKVTDFGLAKARALAGEGDGQSMGQSILVSWGGMTPPYRSPEQATRQGLSRKTDIWSWGVSVLEMFVGERTWMAGEVAREVLASHAAQAPTIPAMPAEVVKLLARCFQPRPEDRPATMLKVATALQAIYASLVGYPYLREMPTMAEARADSLNNGALSLFDLGKVEEAQEIWEQALKVDPQHLESTYNRGIILWRRGELTDDVLVQQLEGVGAAQGQHWSAAYLLAQVHLERGDGDTALTLLEEGVQRAPAEIEMQVLLKQIQARTLPHRRCLRTFEGHTDGGSSHRRELKGSD